MSVGEDVRGDTVREAEGRAGQDPVEGTEQRAVAGAVQDVEQDAEHDADKATSTFQKLRDKYPWLDHFVRAGERYTERNGDYYAAAITYFSVLSLFPLILVAVSAIGYVLFLKPDLLEQLKTSIMNNAPAGLGDLVIQIVNNAINSRGSIGIIALLGALYTGIGWMSNLREALSVQWGQVPAAPPIWKRIPLDLLTLIGLGVAMVGSFAITAAVGGFASTILGWIGLGGVGWARFLLQVLGVVLGLVANWLIFLWVITRLPREHATFRSAAKAAVLGAVGFEILKNVMTFYLKGVTNSPTGQIIGPFVGLMVFAFFVSRFILFVTAYAATGTEQEKDQVPGTEEADAASSVVKAVPVRPRGQNPAELLAAGAVAGFVGAFAVLWRLRK